MSSSSKLFKKFNFQDFTKVLRIGYENFQRVAISLEFVFNDIEAGGHGVMIQKYGRFWRQCKKQAFRIVQSIYLSLKSDPHRPNLSTLPAIARCNIPSAVRYNGNESFRDLRDWFILRNTLRETDNFLRHINTAYSIRNPPASRSSR